jgi:ribose/xylose/arabinose/galactoside ABC-type transport system permease subunit
MTSRLREYVLEAVLVMMCIALAVAAPGFLSPENLLNVLRNVSMQGIVAFGMTMVIIAGEIDLSVGSAVAFAGCLTAWLAGALNAPNVGMPMTAAIPIAILASLVAGMLTGLISGVLRVRFGVPTFITTLAWLTILRGISGLVTGGFQLISLPPWYGFFGGGRIWQIPVPAIVFILVFLVIWAVMNYTTFGRAVYAVGGNAEASRLSGIHVDAVKIGVMVIVSALSVLAGIMQSSQIMQGSHTTAMGWELDIIAAVIIGGTSLSGGAGRVWGTLIGVLFLGVLVNGMTLLNISEFWQQVVRGALILSAVLMNVAPSSRR